MSTAILEGRRAAPPRTETWRVWGRVTYSTSGRPAVAVRVTAMDADLFFHDHLGEAVTDGDGCFEITFGPERFRDVLELAPDIYLLVRDGLGHLLADTRDAVLRNAGREQEIHVQLPGAGPEPALPVTEVGGVPVDRAAFERLRADDLIAMARFAIHGEGGPAFAEELCALSPGLDPAVLQRRLCFTPLVRFLRETVRVKRWPREVALELEEILTGYHPYAGYASFSTANFTLNFETTGSDQPPADDSGGNILMPGTGAVVGTTAAGNGVPDYVEKLGFWLENALALFTNPPFGLKNPAAGGKIPVHVTGLAPGFAGGGEIVIGRNLNDDLLAAVPTHELMHLIQDLYETAGTAGGWNEGVREGGAVLAEDVVFETHNRYVVLASTEAGEVDPSPGTLRAPQASLKDWMQCYQLSLFLKYLSEQQSARISAADEPTIGVETYRTLLERFDALGYTDAAFAEAVAALPWYQDLDRFGYLDAARLDETSSETLLGNFWLACYLKDLGTGLPDRRFEFMEDEEDASWDSLFAGMNVVDTLGDVRLEVETTLAAGGSVTLSSGAGGAVPAFGARFYRVGVDPGVDTLKVNFSAGAGFTRPLVQVVLLEPGNQVRDILRTDRTTWSRTIANRRGGSDLAAVLIVVAGTDTGGSFGLSVSEVPAAPDVTVTRWHHAAGRHYEIDSLGWAWTWVSPDVWVDNDGNGTADSEVYFGQNNRLYVRLHNQGHGDASGIGVELWYQDAAGGLSDAAWLPVKNLAGVTQKLTGLALAAGASDRWAVDWAPAPSGTSHHFCVRAVVTVPGDPNTDNKRCLSNFANVVAGSPYVDLPLLRRVPLHFKDTRVEVIPRTFGRWVVSEADLARAAANGPDVGRPVVDTFRLRRVHLTRVGERQGAPHFTPPKASPAWFKGNRVEKRPDPFGHYPTDPAALPPGLAGVPLITIAHVVDGRPLGGFTWALREPS